MIPQILIATFGLLLGKKAYKKIVQTPEDTEKKETTPPSDAGSKNDISSDRSLVQSVEEKREKTEAEKMVDTNVVLSGGATGMAVAGALFFPPLGIVSGVLTLYTCIPLFQIASDSIIKNKSCKKIEVLDSIAISATLIGGYYTVSALSCLVYYMAQKLKMKTEYKVKQELTNIFSNQPQSVWLLKDGVEVE
ncbi:MAG: hypothetical protein HQK62_06045, partial [Desulfamplus sp.]|nr:hypothetical protein [Desulfamplus sp.]